MGGSSGSGHGLKHGGGGVRVRVQARGGGSGSGSGSGSGRGRGSGSGTSSGGVQVQSSVPGSSRGAELVLSAGSEFGGGVRWSRVWSGVQVRASVQGSGPEFGLEFRFGLRFRVRVPSSVCLVNLLRQYFLPFREKAPFQVSASEKRLPAFLGFSKVIEPHAIH